MAHIQVFDWILELIQARQAWMNSPVQQVNALGLLFVAPENSNSQVLISNFFAHLMICKQELHVSGGCGFFSDKYVSLH